jgi:cysteine synthase
MWSWFTNGNTDTKDGDSFAEGIGQMRVTKNLEGIVVDRAYRIQDQPALTIVYQLLREEGCFSDCPPASTSRARCASPKSAGRARRL